jgi:hypothetical protein
MFDAPVGFRVTLEHALLVPGPPALRRGICIVDPDIFLEMSLRRRAAQHLDLAFAAPARVRYALLLGFDHALVRRVLWESYHQPGERALEEMSKIQDVPQDMVLSDGLHRRLRMRLRNLNSDARDLVRRLTAALRMRAGLRGLAISIRGEAHSIDVFRDAEQTLASLPHLVLGAMIEAVEDPFASVPIFRGRNFLSRRVATIAEHRILVRVLARAKALPGESTYRAKMKTPLKALASVRKGADERLVHALVIREH